jgi:phage virion morphogenesis protein
MASITIKVDDSQVRELLAKIQSKTKNLTPAMKIIGEIILKSVKENFRQGGRPERWKPLAKSTLRDIKKRDKKILIKDKRLMNSLTYRASSRNVVIGTNVDYAAIHHFGGRTSPHIIKPRRKKALFWPGAKCPVKLVKHPGSDIPARPFLMVQDEDWKNIRRTLADYLLRR